MENFVSPTTPSHEWPHLRWPYSLITTLLVHQSIFTISYKQIFKSDNRSMAYFAPFDQAFLSRISNMNIEGSTYDRRGLLAYLERNFKIDWHGIHGINHWLRVHCFGAQIGMRSGADLAVVELFAYLHDCCRIAERLDPSHGERGAEFAHRLNGTFYTLSELQLDQLCTAIRFHSDGWIHTDPTIQSCWDGDRLDLGRVGIQPHPDFLSTHAKQFLEEASAVLTDIH